MSPARVRRSWEVASPQLPLTRSPQKPTALLVTRTDGQGCPRLDSHSGRGRCTSESLGEPSMPSQRRTLPETTPEPEPETASAPASATGRTPVKLAGYRACRTCKHAVPASALLHGQCPDCAGLQPLPLRGEGGRFLPGLTPRSSSPSHPWGGAR